MSTITLNTQTVVSIAAGDVLELPVSAGQARIIGLNVGGDATLRPLSGGTIDGTAGDYSIGSGNYVLFTSGSQGSTWCLLSEGSSTPVVESVSGTSGQIASTGGTDPVLSFTWSASANQLVRYNNAGTAYGAVTLFAGSNMTIDHTANGITLTSSGGGGGGGELSKVVKVLSSSEILNLGTTPIELIPAQGAGTVIVPLMWSCRLNYNSVAYVLAGESAALRAVYNGPAFRNCIPSNMYIGDGTFWTETQDKLLFFGSNYSVGSDFPAYGTITSGDAPEQYENCSVLLNIDGGAGNWVTTGNSTATICMWYVVITTS